MKARFVDTHCHLDHPSLLSRIDEVAARARAAGVDRFIVPGVDPAGWEVIARLATATPGVFPAFGLHPMLASRYSEELMEELARFAGQAVAIGEIGLDYALADVPRETQAVAFRGQLRLAVSLGVPVLIHCRRAFGDLVRIVREENVAKVGGVMHAFSGSPEVARDCIGEGLLISLAGTVTYRNAVKGPRVASQVSAEHLLLESDAPDMAPEPHRGSVNEPANLVATARAVADVRGVTLAELARQTTANAERLFRL